MKSTNLKVFHCANKSAIVVAASERAAVAAVKRSPIATLIIGLGGIGIELLEWGAQDTILCYDRESGDTVPCLVSELIAAIVAQDRANRVITFDRKSSGALEFENVSIPTER